MKSITIIIPFFNDSSSISRTLGSINNALDNVKKRISLTVKIVNDGSSEHELLELKKIITNFNTLSIELLTKPNGGVSSARNLGLKGVVSDYIYFLDADDTLLPNFFSYVAEPPTSVNMYFNLKINKRINKHNLEKIFTMNDDLFSDLFVSRVCHLSSIIFHRDNINGQIFNESYKTSEDHLYIYENLSSNKVFFINDVISQYRYDGKFYSAEKNALPEIVEKTESMKLNEVICKSISENQYLHNKFIKETFVVSGDFISYKIMLLGFFRSEYMYRLFQKIRS
ncbi:glycosyltransferase family A protein [Vibrio chagasii]|uniref:glycosyltransferase family A protein n=3 Tax=Vibrio TaxID=662 RepID=UPI00354B1F6F